MAKPTLKVTLPDGTIATRKTARTYTHVVIAKGYTLATLERKRGYTIKHFQGEIKYDADQIASGVVLYPSLGYTLESLAERIKVCEAELLVQEARDLPAEYAAQAWDAVSWSSRADLAAKAANQWVGFGYDQVQVIALERKEVVA